MDTTTTTTTTCSEVVANSPAMKALGSLFNLTQIFICDDGYSGDNQQSLFPKHIRFKYDDDDDDDDDKDGGKNSSISGIENSGEDRIGVENGVVVSEEMTALGLPLSFQTNRHKRGGKFKGKSRFVQVRSQNGQERPDEQVEESAKSNEERPYHAVKPNNASSASLPDQCEHSGCGSDVPIDMAADHMSDVLEEHFHDSSPLNVPTEAVNDDLVGVDLQMEMEIEMMRVDEGSNLPTTNTSSGSNILDDCLEDDTSLTEQLDAESLLLGNTVMPPQNSGSAIAEEPQVSELSEDSQNMVVPDQGYSDTGRWCGTCGDWSAYWDAFYWRYYFYNDRTKESTWDPPPVMENFGSGESFCSGNESNMGLPGTDTGIPIDQSEAQSDHYEFDKTGLDDAIKPHGGGGCDLLSDSAAYSMSFVTSELRESSGVDDHGQDEMTLRLSLNTVEHSHMPENYTEQNDSGEVSNDFIKSKDSVSVGSPCENTGISCNLTAQWSNASSSTCAADATCADDFTYIMHPEEEDTTANDLHMLDASADTKQTIKRRSRRKKSFTGSETIEFYQGEESYIGIRRYWRQRYLLFSRFDDGIKMDTEGWFSVTPEAIARHQASRCGGGTVIDCFTGAGGNAIQFAKTSKHVIAIDIDPIKIEYARHNAAIYGVEDKIDFMIGDSLTLTSKIKADAVFLSPPWGGPDYVQLKSYSLDMLQPYSGQLLFDTYKVNAPMIIMFLPRNINIEELAELSLSADPPWSLEVEKNYLNGRLKAVTAYFRSTSVSV